MLLQFRQTDGPEEEHPRSAHAEDVAYYYNDQCVQIEPNICYASFN